jgi:hypothetical protein
MNPDELLIYFKVLHSSKLILFCLSLFLSFSFFVFLRVLQRVPLFLYFLLFPFFPRLISFISFRSFLFLVSLRSSPYLFRNYSLFILLSIPLLQANLLSCFNRLICSLYVPSHFNVFSFLCYAWVRRFRLSFFLSYCFLPKPVFYFLWAIHPLNKPNWRCFLSLLNHLISFFLSRSLCYTVNPPQLFSPIVLSCHLYN